MWAEYGRLRAVLSLIWIAGTLTPSLLVAQEDTGGGEWELGGQTGATFFYGSAQQFSVTVRSDAGYETDRLEFGAKATFDYGEATDRDGNRIVSNRAWTANFNIDYDGGDWAPFINIGARGSLQRRLDRRVDLGAGSRYRVIRNDRTQVDLSLSLAAERTDPRVAAGEVRESTTKGRWSWLLRAGHAFGPEERFEMDFETEYEPGLDRFRDDFVVDTELSLAYAVTSSVDFQITFENTYDSLADDRGAGANNDGRIFFLIGASIG